MPYVETEPGVRIFYQDRGHGAPILFVHGWGMNHAVWDYAVMDLAGDYRCISVDLRGHGASDKPFGDYSYDTFCRDLRAVLIALDVQGATYVGWSMGGGIGMKYILEYGDRVSRLVLVSPVVPRLTATPAHPYGTPPDQIPALLEMTRQNMLGLLGPFLGLNFHKQGFEFTQQWFLQMAMQVPVFVAYRTYQAMIDEDFTPQLGRVRVPVQIFHGRNDKICDPRWSEFLLDQLSGLGLTWFEESGHVCFLEERDKFTQELLRVLS